MKYTDTHEWIALDQKEGIATVGITDYAQKELGDVVYIEFPKVGNNISMGEEVIILESTKAAIDLYSPVSGSIVAINDQLRETPEKINLSPTKEGWLYKIRITNPSEYEGLMDEASYQQLISGD
jgi:glycine cleavage system H protein